MYMERMAQQSAYDETDQSTRLSANTRACELTCFLTSFHCWYQLLHSFPLAFALWVISVRVVLERSLRWPREARPIVSPARGLDGLDEGPLRL